MLYRLFVHFETTGLYKFLHTSVFNILSKGIYYISSQHLKPGQDSSLSKKRGDFAKPDKF